MGDGGLAEVFIVPILSVVVLVFREKREVVQIFHEAKAPWHLRADEK